MDILISNAHDEDSGGGGYYCSQVIKAISEIGNVYLTNKPREGRFLNNPELKCSWTLDDKSKKYDYFIDVNHFCSITTKRANKNIKLCYFPSIEHDVSGYDFIVTLSEYSAKYVKEFWNRNALICKPYSKNLVGGVKKPNTIISTGNIFYESDGHCKNQHILIDAFKKLEGNWNFKIIGNVLNEEYFSFLQESAEGYNIEFYPSLDDKTKEAFLKESEFYWHGNGFMRTLPTQSEHFGIGAEEALKSGCLVYVPDNGGVRDFCTTWGSVNDLVAKTKERYPNKCIPKYQTHDGMTNFFKNLLTKD